MSSNLEKSNIPVELSDFMIDNSAPVTDLKSDGPKKEDVFSPKSSFELSSEDDEAGVKGIFLQY